MNEVHPSILGAMGNSPMVELSRITEELELEGRLLAKLDYLLPGSSKKDRAARQTVLDARASGELSEGQTVVELTSGNMGTGLAIACGVMGHPFIAVMSEGNSEERAAMMAALGAQVVRVPQAEGSMPGEVSGRDLTLVEEEAQKITSEVNGYRADQFKRMSNTKAHVEGTGPEIWQQSGGNVTAFCDFVGSGGTLGGVSRFLGEKGVRCYGIEPEGAEALAGGRTDRPEHPIQGGGYTMAELDHLERAEIEGYLTVSGDEAKQHARLLARREGIFGGFSGGANLAGAVQLLRGAERGGCVAFLVCDSGLKYLSTDLWEYVDE